MGHTETREFTYPFGTWRCTESIDNSDRLEWCSHLKTLILRSCEWNERGPVGRELIALRHQVWYSLITVSQAIEWLLAGRGGIIIPKVASEE